MTSVSNATHATAKDLAAIYRVAVGTIYGWACKDDWGRTGWPRMYSRADAQASYERRYPARENRNHGDENTR
jgi:hypothetical protein